MNPYSPIIGSHVGACVNQTVNISDNFVMTIYGYTGRRVHGEIVLGGVLGGGGPFRGIVATNRISFATSNPAQQLLVRWTGVIKYGCLQGTYFTHCDHPDVEDNLRRQNGVWNCKLIRGLSETTLKPTTEIHIFYGDTEEGPFNHAEFIAGLDSHRWPANGIVGTIVKGRTNWNTVAECLEILKQEDASNN